MNEEIERKFLVSVVPDGLGAGLRLRQGYLAVSGDTNVRIRDLGDAQVLTVKGGAGMRRVEVELLLSPAQFDALWPLTEGRRLEKTRYRVPIGIHTAELDVFEGDLHGLRLVEVEFDSVTDAQVFQPPDWFGVDVTGEPQWSNASLALNGRPG